MAVTRVDQPKDASLGAPPRRSSWRNSETTFGLLMVAPAVLVLVLVLLYPAFVALQTSFYKVATVTRQETFVGLENYTTVLTSPEFWASFRRSVIWTAGAMTSQMV